MSDGRRLIKKLMVWICFSLVVQASLFLDAGYTEDVDTKTRVSQIDALDIPWDIAALEQNIDWNEYPSQAVVATGYTAGVESTGKTPDHPQYGITYSGVKVRRDLYSTIAADPEVFPLGTILYIPDYGYGVVADTGGAIKGNKIDLYFEEVEDVYTYWGKKEVDVYMIKKGEGHLTETLLDHLNNDETIQVYNVNS